MADKCYPILNDFKGEYYPLSFLKNTNFISGTEEGLIKIARFRMGMRDLESVPFFYSAEIPQIVFPFVALRKTGFLKHFYENDMFKIMDTLYYPMRMKIIQSYVSDLSSDSRELHWQKLSACLRKDCKTSLKDKELSTVFAVGESLDAIRYYLDHQKKRTPKDENLSEECKKMTAEFDRHMEGIPEFYYSRVLSSRDKLCSHSDPVFEQKSRDFVWDAVNCFDILRIIRSNELISEEEKNEKILKLAELANKALFYHPYVDKKIRVKLFDLTSDFPERIKVAYHKRKMRNISQESDGHIREE